MDQVVPLNPIPNQVLSVPLTLDGTVTYVTLTLRYNEIAGYWVMTLADGNGNLLLDSVPLVTGLNLLDQFAYLETGKAAIINASGITTLDYPNSFNLGSDFLLIWGDTPAL